jgi:hypothetical protein
LFNTYPTLIKENVLTSYSDLVSSELLFPARKAKKEALSTLLKALTGDLPPALYLSSIDCGGGKSRLIQDFLRLWKGARFRPAGSVLICLSRLAEIDDFARKSGLDETDYAVVTNDADRNRYGLGRERANSARVLFTTQQMIRAKLNSGDPFESLSEFFYLGHPRSCRIWDESLVPEEVVISVDSLAALPGLLRAYDPDIATEVGNLSGTALTHNDSIVVPATLADEIRARFPRERLAELRLPKQAQQALSSLVTMGGRRMGVGGGYRGQRSLIGVKPSLPKDFYPVIVFDASGRVRSAYQMRELDVPLRHLPSLTNSYQNLKVHWWNKAFGKDTRANPTKRAEVLAVAAELINSDPEDGWLVIHHKAEEGNYDIEGELRDLLADQRSAEFLHWGDHHGTNKFREIKKVLVLGMFRKPEAAYTALAMGVSGKPFDEVVHAEREFLRLGEHRHDLLQAICRSNVRNAVEGVAGQADVYLVAGGSWLHKEISSTFPDCTLIEWVPRQRDPTGQLARVIALLQAYKSDPTVITTTKKQVREAAGIASSHGLSQVLRDPRVQDVIRRREIGVRKHRFVFKNAA